MMKRPFAVAMLAFLPAFAGSVVAAQAQPAAVVELFTSQGCSSCPPADALLTGLAQEEDVFALAYHVE